MPADAPSGLLYPTLTLPMPEARLRPWHRDDAAALTEHANDRSIWLNSRDRFPHPYVLADATHYLEAATAASVSDLHLCMEVDGEAAGSISVLFKSDVERRSAELGYFLGRRHRGGGITSAAVRALTEHAFAHFDLCRVYAMMHEHNLASVRVVEKAGYELEARMRKAITKDGQTFDALLYALVR